MFLETRPVTKVDTQISMRFAQQIACSEAGIDCSKYDFIYTVTADSGIIGGPSAGAAAAALTSSVLVGEDIRSGVAITGTINSGGLVGAVGGLHEKIGAAQRFHTVLIPAGTRYGEWNNLSIDLVKYGAEKGVVVVEVDNLDQIMKILTGLEPKEKKDLVIDESYNGLMREIAEDLCGRSAELRKEFYDTEVSEFNETLLVVENVTLELDELSKRSFEEGDYYSTASYCFRTSVNYQFMKLKIENVSKKDVVTKVQLLQDGVKRFRNDMQERPLPTITALQSSIIVLDRLSEAQEYIDLIKNNPDNPPEYILSFATERLHSAVAWSKFFDLPSAEYNVNPGGLKDGCIRKIQEAQERYQYVQFYIPNSIESVRSDIQRAMDYNAENEYPFCLFTAAKAKAQANVVVGLIGANKESMDDILERKLEAVEEVIAKSQQKGQFPIIGYSYYQYAKSLKDSDKSSALLFAEYALELSNLDLYFPKGKTGDRLDGSLFFVGLFTMFLLYLRIR